MASRPASPTAETATFEKLLHFGQKRRYYTPAEVSMHNSKEDCWVSIHGKVFDLAQLLAANKPELGRALVLHAGKDISSWFEEETLEIKTQLDPVTGLVAPHVPYGRFPHVPPRDPLSDWANDFVTPWWADTTYLIGTLSKRTRFITVVNTITTQLARTLLEVCSEETLAEIQSRYLVHNAHAGSYAWKVADEAAPGHFKVLDMEKTLEENGISDETEKLDALSIDPAEHYPVVTVYFKDDLTVE